MTRLDTLLPLLSERVTTVRLTNTQCCIGGGVPPQIKGSLSYWEGIPAPRLLPPFLLSLLIDAPLTDINDSYFNGGEPIQGSGHSQDYFLLISGVIVTDGLQ